MSKKISAPPRLSTNQLFVQNLLLERQLWLKRLLDPRRDIDLECGHPQEINITDYKRLFVRGDVAARVVTLFPEESWDANPQVHETDEETETEFERAFDELNKELHLLSMMQRIDTLSGVGRFGVLLLGIDDGLNLDQPVAALNGRGEKVGDAQHKLLYLRAFDESVVTVDSAEADPTNPRFGLPKVYDVTFEDVGGLVSGNKKVHWSRVIHVADNRQSSEVFGRPRMEVVYNRLLDIRKIAGGSGEMFWKGGFPGLSLESHPQLTEDVELDTAAVKKEIEAYMNGLQRYIATVGMRANSLSVQVADPNPAIMVQLKLISTALGVPWRVFVGSEAAQLASEQDAAAWNRRITRRREEYLNPYLILPTVERLIAFGILPEPKEILITWPDRNVPGQNEQADVAVKRTQAMAQWVQSGSDLIMPPFHFLTLILGLTDDQARAVLEDAVERTDDGEEEREGEGDEGGGEDEGMLARRGGNNGD